MQDHAAELLRFARRFSHCADDAHDAYQRSLEILVRRMRVEPPEQPLKWMRTVLRHEALSVRAQREQLVGRVEVDFDRHEGRHVEDPVERAVGHEQLRHTAEALQRLKPQEVTALVLRAEGLSYKEICARTGWSYTRCNRAVTEGRRALRERLGAIESGAECDRWMPLLSALADGEATSADLAELRPHLRGCSACRATLRDFHAAPAQIAALVPASLVPLASEPAGSLLGHVETALHGLADRVTTATLRVHGVFEGLAGGKVAAVAASTAAIAGGGVALDQATRTDRPPARAGAPAAVVDASDGRTTLATLAAIVAPLPRPADGSPTRHPPRRGEFAAAASGTSPEFAARTRTSGEFASTTAPSASRATGPPSSTASSPSGAASPPPSALPPPQPAPARAAPEWEAPEFGGP